MSLCQTNVHESFDVVTACEKSVIQQHSRSFTFASWLLPVAVRDDVQKLYAWCRWCDDAVDSAPNLDDAGRQLSVLRDDVQRIYQGDSVRHAASKWLADLVDRYEIQMTYPLALLDAMAMDLRLGQIENKTELLKYCHGAAGVVGLMLCQIFNVRDARANRHASALGIAMQLTNIARDVLEDCQRGRCYLPKTWLCNDIGAASNDDIRRSVCKILDLAESYYQTADAGMHFLPNRIRPAIRVAAAVYRDIGVKIRTQDCDVMRGRIVTSQARFAASAVSASVRGVITDASRQKEALLSTIMPSKQTCQSPLQMEIEMKDAKYVAWLGLSLTSFMGGALFLLVSLNPKDDSYSYLPLVYAGVCLVVGALANIVARQNESPTPDPVPVSDERMPDQSRNGSKGS